ncbi:MAG: hypothetical protein AB1715_07785 [Acidobacteriota bacterium]
MEVVLNHLKPYRLRDEASTLALQKISSIDTEEEATAAQGVGDIFEFNVDSEGSIYILCPPKGPGNLIFKYSSEGKLLASFGRMGQGPNEMEYPHYLQITAEDEVWVLESPKNKYHVFSSEGAPIAEKILSIGFEKIVPLENGALIISRLLAEDMSAKYFSMVIGLYDSAFQPIKELDRFESVPNKIIAASLPEKIVNGIEHVFLAKPAGDRIFVGNSGRGYEILVYDLKGGLVRKIRKEYTPVRVPEEYKKEYLKMYEEFMPDYAKKIYFPDDWHPFKSFFGDDAGRLFVMTYEPGANPKEYVCDIFNKDGVFISRASLSALGKEPGMILARARGDLLYCVQEKESGYKELTVYKMT